MSKVLITGGAGYLGTHTCLSLLKKGFELVVIDSYINSSPNSLLKLKDFFKEEKFLFDKLHIYEGDLRDREFICEVFKKNHNGECSFDGVIHFAGLKSVSESIKYPLKYWDFNVKGTINLIEVMSKFNCFTIVFSSSATIYEVSDASLIKENALKKPLNPYGQTKLVIEQILENLYESKTNEWKIANLRYFNPIGAHPSGIIGEDSKEMPNNIFPLINKVAFGELKNLKIFGNNWPTHDGTPIRDYIHVMDLAEAHVLALKKLINKKNLLLNINIGTGIGTSVLDLIKTFEEVNKIKINYIFTKRRDGDLGIVVADNSYAYEELNWKPKFNLNDMCRDGWNWKMKNPEGFT